MFYISYESWEPPLHDGDVINELLLVTTKVLKPKIQKSRPFHRKNRILRHFPGFSHAVVQIWPRKSIFWTNLRLEGLSELILFQYQISEGVWKFTTFLAVMQCFDPKTAGEKLRYLTEYGLKVKNHGFYCHFLFLGIIFELGEWKSKKNLFHSNATCQPTV